MEGITPVRVLVCDDRIDDCQRTQEAVVEGAPPDTVCEALGPKSLPAALAEFFASVEGTIESGQSQGSKFDGYDIIVIDNNLSHLNTKGARLTAESVAGYVRAFSNTPYVVSLNKNEKIDFDLRFLVGDYSTRADIALNSRHLSNPALWTRDLSRATDGFCPWYWPALIEAPGRRRVQIDFIRENLDEKILPSLGFPDSSISALSGHAKGTLSPSATDGELGKPITEVTFREFFETTPKSLPIAEDRSTLIRHEAVEIISRVVAAEIDGWFRRDGVGPQDVLVDVPHLLVRMPFLLGKRAGELAAWNTSATSATPPFGLEDNLFKRYLNEHAYRLDFWTQSPCFWWHPLRQSEDLGRIFFESDTAWGDFVFCEDRSQFSVRTEGGDGPIEFVTEHEGSGNRRYVGKIGEYGYSPRSRFAR